MENAITGTSFSVYTASGISSCKIKFEKSGRQACHSYGNGSSEAVHWLHVFHTSCHCLLYNLFPLYTPLTHLHSAPGEKRNAAAKRRFIIHTPTETLLLPVSIAHYPCLFLRPLTYSYYQGFTSCLMDCHGSMVNISAANTHFSSWIAALF